MGINPSGSIHGVILIEPKIFSDQRGKFFESFVAARYLKAGVLENFVQDNMSFSYKNTLRGLHFQQKYPQGKLVTVLMGKVYDVVLDLRQSSSTFGEHIGLWLDDVAHHQIYIPPGCAHGFYVVSDFALLHYKCTDYYHHEDESGLMWNDPALNIDWPLIGEPIISEKDKLYKPFNKNDFL